MNLTDLKTSFVAALGFVAIGAALQTTACSSADDSSASDSADVKASIGKQIGKVGSQQAIVLEGDDAFVVFSGKLHRYALKGGVDETVASLPASVEEMAMSRRYLAVSAGFPETLHLLDRENDYTEVAKVEMSVDALDFVNDDTVAVAGFGHVSLVKADGTVKTLFGDLEKSDPIVRIVKRSLDGKRVFALVEEDLYSIAIDGNTQPKKLFTVGDIGFPHFEGFRVNPKNGDIASTLRDFDKDVDVVQLHDKAGKLLAEKALSERMIFDFAFAGDAIFLVQAGPTNDEKSQLHVLDAKTLEVESTTKFEGKITWLEPTGDDLVFVFSEFQKLARRLYVRDQ